MTSMSEPKRMHPVAALTGLLGAVREFIVPIVLVFFFGRSDSYFGWFILGSLILPFGYSIGRWLRFTYHLEGYELVVNEGLFVRKKITIPRNRVQSVDVTAGVIQRLFNLVSVQIRTAGGNDSKVELSAVTRGEADAIVGALRSSAVVGQPAAEAETPRAVDEVYSLGGRDLVFAGVTSGRIGVILSIVATVAAQFDDFIDMDKIEEAYGAWAPFFADSVIGLILVAFVGTWVLSILGTIVTYFGFSLTADREELRVRYGLFSQKQVSIPFRRIQAVRFTEGLLRQPFGYGALYVESAGEGDQKQLSSCIVAPFVHKSAVAGIIEAIQPELNFHAAWEKLPARSKSRYIVRLLRPSAVLILAAIWFVPYGWLSLGLVPLCFILGSAQHKTAAFAFADNRLRLRTRALARDTVTLKRNRVQSATFSTNWFLHRRDLWSFRVALASISKNLVYGISFLGREQEPLFRKWVMDGIRGTAKPALASTDDVYPLAPSAHPAEPGAPVPDPAPPSAPDVDAEEPPLPNGPS